MKKKAGEQQRMLSFYRAQTKMAEGFFTVSSSAWFYNAVA
ncbi:unnamed protein product [Gongylonema pulchrum]|uniref:Transcriptional regulator n=1 Tax=Gongylonema pulchrum TaxID=637853 RepID=A0A183EJX5_9BILA|nr:unnamed protein product [Gongylonema pulchrum]